jgi:hypothetical protein
VAEPATKRAPSDYARATAVGARKRGTAITPANAAKLLAAAVKLPKDAAGRMVGSAALCAEVGLGSPDYITRCLLAEAGRKHKRGEPLIEVVQQPAQSPDFNINDLAFFRALSVAVRKRRRTLMRGPKRFDIDQLVDDVKQAFDEYPPEQLEKMWQHKSYVMGAVLTTKRPAER